MSAFAEVNDLEPSCRDGRGVDPTKGRRDVCGRDVLAARAARPASPPLPVVMAVAGDPVKLGLLLIGAAGGNVTGFTYIEDQFAPKQLNFSRRSYPHSLVWARWWTPPIRLLRVGGPPRRRREVSRLHLDAVQVRAPTNFEDVFSDQTLGAGALIVVLARITLPAIELPRSRSSAGSSPWPHTADSRKLGFLSWATTGSSSSARPTLSTVSSRARRPSDCRSSNPHGSSLVVNLLDGQGSWPDRYPVGAGAGEVVIR